jgi:hypothetical protein
MKMEDSEILEILKKSEEDGEWVSESFQNLRSKYSGKVLAVKGKHIVSCADTVEELIKSLEKTDENIGLLLIEAVPPKGLSFIL